MSNATYHVRTRTIEARLIAAVDEQKQPGNIRKRHNAPGLPLWPPIAAKPYVAGSFGVTRKAAEIH